MFCERLGAGHHQLRVSWDLAKFSKNELSNVRIEYKGQWLLEQLTQQLLPIIEVGSSNPVFGKKLK